MLASSRVAEAIATLKVLGHAELIKTTETLDREALKRQPVTFCSRWALTSARWMSFTMM